MAADQGAKETWKQMITGIQAAFDEEVANALEALRHADKTKCV